MTNAKTQQQGLPLSAAQMSFQSDTNSSLYYPVLLWPSDSFVQPRLD